MSPDTPSREDALRALSLLSDEELRKLVTGRIGEDPRHERVSAASAFWRRWSGTIAVVTLFAFAAWGLSYVQGVAEDAEVAAKDAQATATALEEERQTRVSTVSGVIDLGCQTDNQQDLILATLIGASIQDTPRSEVPPDQRGFYDTFVNAQAQLQELLECDEIIRLYQKGEEVDPTKILGPKNEDARRGE